MLFISYNILSNKKTIKYLCFQVSEQVAGNSASMSENSSKVIISDKNDSEQPSLIRKKFGKSRFAPSDVVPSTLTLQETPIIDLQSDDLDNKQPSLSLNINNSLKKPIISKILAPTEPIMSIVDTDLKVTSSNSCRKVEFQSGNIDKSITSKESPQDLRFTLSKNRTKYQNNNENGSTIDDQIKSDEESTITTNKSISSKIQAIKEDKQQR